MLASLSISSLVSSFVVIVKLPIAGGISLYLTDDTTIRVVLGLSLSLGILSAKYCALGSSITYSPFFNSFVTPLIVSYTFNAFLKSVKVPLQPSTVTFPIFPFESLISIEYSPPSF